MNRILVLGAILLLLSACGAPATQAEPGLVPTLIVEPVFTQPSGNGPVSEAEVPRVSLEEAKAALDSGAAVMVDVRGDTAYEAGHVPGAISIPLADIEANPSGLSLDKDQWIITYCT